MNRLFRYTCSCVPTGALVVALVLAVFGGPAQANFITDFNGADASVFTNNFLVNQNGAPLPTSISWSGSAGVLDQPGPAAGGGLTYGPTAGDPTADYNGNYFVLTGGPSTVSIMVKTTATPTGGDKIQIGFLNLFNRSFNGEMSDSAGPPPVVGTAFITSRLLPTGANNLQVQIKPRNGATATTNLSTLALAGNEWYKLTSVITPTGTDGQYTVGTKLDDYGTDGVTFAANKFDDTATPTTVTVLGMGAAEGGGAAVAGFRYGSANAAAALDNFNVLATNGTPIPEPSALVLLLTGVLGLVHVVRKRIHTS
jgi:hypothetical protein